MTKNPYRDPNCPPPYRAGDIVRSHSAYSGWPKNEYRAIEEVVWTPGYSNSNFGYWSYRIRNPLKDEFGAPGYSLYNPKYFYLERKEDTMAQAYKYTNNEKSSGMRVGYVGIKCDYILHPDCHLSELRVDSNTMTKMCFSEGEALEEIGKIGKPEERWIVMRTSAIVDVEPPRPPLKVTRF